MVSIMFCTEFVLTDPVVCLFLCFTGCVSSIRIAICLLLPQIDTLQTIHFMFGIDKL